MIKKWLSLFLLLAISCIGTYGYPYTAVDDENPFLRLNDGVEELDFLTDVEKEVILELNKARTNPAAYAKVIEDYKRHYVGREIQFAGRIPYYTQEGVSAVDEAIRFLKTAEAVPPLRVSRGLSYAAQAHVKDQGPTGLTGHSGSDKSTPRERIERFGEWGVTMGENISYGFWEAKEIVMQLIIDDGVKNRGHRKNIYNGGYRVAGVGFGPHHSFSRMCVIDFAGTYTEED